MQSVHEGNARAVVIHIKLIFHQTGWITDIIPNRLTRSYFLYFNELTDTVYIRCA